MRHALPLFAASLFAWACSAPPPDTDACATSSDCADGEQCLDARCVPASEPGPDSGPSDPHDAGHPRPDSGPLVLTIEPADPLIETDGSATTLQLHAWAGGVELSDVNWRVDDVVVGTISPGGLVTAHGYVAGEIEVTAQHGLLEATTTVTVRVSASETRIETLTPEQIDALRAGGPSVAEFRWLYPYDETVFPRGLSAPSLQLSGGGADAVRVTLDLEASGFHYEGFFAGSDPLQIALRQEVWDGATESARAADPLLVGVTKLVGDSVIGPVTQRYHIAQGALTGTVYYNSYRSPLAGNTGAILSVRFGEEAQVVKKGCTVCHSVSANGNRIATGLNWSSTDTITGTGNPVQSGTIDLGAGGSTTPRRTDPDGRKFAFAALTPDGALALSNAVPPARGIRGLSGVIRSSLWDATTGEMVPAPSFTDLIQYAVTPQFAADGSAVAFSWFLDDGSANGRVLAVMSFDQTASPPAFGAPRTVVEIAAGEGIVGWPSFTPDGDAVIYQEGDYFDTSISGGTGNSNRPSYADLRLVDLTSCDPAGNHCTVSNLERLNGYAGGSFYLPYGEAEEARSNYEPTVLPVAVGGYYWVVFTSRRCYGNTIAPGGTVAGGEDRWGHRPAGGGEIPSVRKKLWVAAIDLSGAPGADRSHPPFYLAGQELESGNMRGFAALDPCRAEGEGCESAAECCGGFCRPSEEDDVSGYVCVPPPAGCALDMEACTTAADCCRAAEGYQCINDRCARPPLL